MQEQDAAQWEGFRHHTAIAQGRNDFLEKRDRLAQMRISKSLVVLGASIGLLASTNGAVVFAEGKERKQKLPIYDEPEPEMVVKEEPTRLDEALRAARQETDRQILGMKYHLQMVTDKVVGLEKEAETNIKSVLVKEEEVMPAALYVVVAGFAGSIFARRRNVLLRFLSPVAFSAMAFGYFFPASANRLIARANQSDFSKYIPVQVQKQIRDISGQVSDGVSSGVNTINQTVSNVDVNKTVDSAENKVTKAVEELKNNAQEVKRTVEAKEESVQEAVQEKYKETVTVAKETVDDVKVKVAQLKKALVEEVGEKKSQVEKAVEESDREKRLAKIRAEDALKRV
ncbi:hypothetical protein EDD11_008427 [Mortierella claussenii]|nr:hypothetical protein EDD11_008427 [Mortierella claussenii]